MRCWESRRLGPDPAARGTGADYCRKKRLQGQWEGIAKAVWIDRVVEVSSLKALLRGKIHRWLRDVNKKEGPASRTIL